MKIKTRLIILGSCAALFLILAPWIVLYSLGYRVDFANMKLRGTGGIYVYAVPEPLSISIDSKLAEKTGLFSSAVFMQNIMPGLHSVLIKKEGYYDYQKNLEVQEKEVAKLENVILFKQKIDFTLLENNIGYFSPSPGKNTMLIAKLEKSNINFEIINVNNGQKKTASLAIVNGKISNVAWSDNATKVLLKINSSYYVLDATGAKPTITALPLLTGASQINFNPQKSDELFFIKGRDFYSNLKIPPIIEDVATYSLSGANITWLSYDGFLYQGDVTGAQPSTISAKAFEIKEGASYQVETINGITFLKENGGLFFLNKDFKTFQLFYDKVTDMKSSPDNQKILYVNDHQIIISSSEHNHQDKILLDVYTDTIKDVQWLNSSYLAVSSGDTISISEIDTRGNINKITLPETITANSILLQTQTTQTTPTDNQQTITLKSPKTFFHWQDKKLYIFSDGNVIVSEKLIP